MSLIDLALANLLSPAILCFGLGALAVLLRSDFRMPAEIQAGISIYLMLAIGLKGGVELSGRAPGEVAGPILAALALGCAIPLWCYAGLRRFAGLGIADAAALAAHYGSVSAVTFAAVTTFLTKNGTPFEGYVAALLALMEVPAIVVALGLAGLAMTATRLSGRGGVVALEGGPAAGLAAPGGSGFGAVLSDTLGSKSVVLLAGGLAIGMLAGKSGFAPVKPLFVDLFPGVLCLFLLELGRLAASRAADFRKVGLKLAAFALAMPVLHAALGILLGRLVGLSEGGSVVLGTLAASASYIAAPAAVRLALPEANPGYYLTCSLAITFPFNILIGLPLYAAMARALFG